MVQMKNNKGDECGTVHRCRKQKDSLTGIRWSCVQILVTCWLFAGAAVAQTQTGLIDNFASDTALNTALWTSAATDYLKGAALSGEGGHQCFSLTNNFVKPGLSFGSGGMQMSGVNGWQQFTGIQSLNTFALPFTFETTVTAAVANGNPFEVHFVSADGKQMFSIYGDVNPANVPYVGIKVGCQVIYATPNVNVAYTIDINATADGAFGVALRAGSIILTTQTFQLANGPPYGPFYLILGQGEGWPNTGKTENVAVWQSVSLQNSAFPQTATCTSGFPLSVIYGGQNYTECIEGNQSAFNQLAANYQGTRWPPLAAQAYYLQGVVNKTQSLTDIQIVSQTGNAPAPSTKYNIAYATLLWGWEYGHLGVTPSSSLQPYHDLRAKIQAYANGNWWREIAVGATDLDTWFNLMYWINQGVNGIFTLAGSSNLSPAQEQFTQFIGLLNTLSRGQQYATTQLGSSSFQAASGSFSKAGICLPQNYTSAQFAMALADAPVDKVDWVGLATDLISDAIPSPNPNGTVAVDGAALAGSCLMGPIGKAIAGQSPTLAQLSGQEMECLATSAATDVTEFITQEALTQEVLDAGMADLAAQEGTDAVVESAAEQTAATDAVGYYVGQSVSQVFLVLSVADTLNESYNLPMANLVGQSIEEANAALKQFPIFFQQVSGLTNGNLANIVAGPFTTDTDSLLNATLADLYLVNAQYCNSTLPMVGCQKQASVFQVFAQQFARNAGAILSAQLSALQIASSLPNATAANCSASSNANLATQVPKPGRQ